ncbi:hypothetical protein C8R43DRAFT_208317 [Mycena crocata]|nr:hypothetical protein C8R43DRAFT_208317 [Mycena crocata]
MTAFGLLFLRSTMAAAEAQGGSAGHSRVSATCSGERSANWYRCSHVGRLSLNQSSLQVEGALWNGGRTISLDRGCWLRFVIVHVPHRFSIAGVQRRASARIPNPLSPNQNHSERPNGINSTTSETCNADPATAGRP